MSKYRIRYISPEDQENLKSWSDTLLDKENKSVQPPKPFVAPRPESVQRQHTKLNEIPQKLTDGILNELVNREESHYEDNLLKKDTIIKKEDMVRMKILTKARHSILKLEHNKQLAEKLELFNKKIRQKKLKAIVRAVKYLLKYDKL